MFWLILISITIIYFLLDHLIRYLKVGGYSNRYVFVTGCDSGFGRELVLRLDKMSFHVFACCYTTDGRRSLQETCSSRVDVLSLDVSSDVSILAAVNTVKQKLPNGNGIWAVVNNAGVIGRTVAAEMCTKKDHQDCYNVNLLGAIEVSRVFMPLLRKSKGRLVNVASCMGRCAAENAPYSVSKFAIEAYSDVVRREVAAFGVKVSLIEPGYTRSGLFHVDELHEGIRESFQRLDPEIQEAYGKDYMEYAQAVLGARLDRLSPHSYRVTDAFIGAITSIYPRPRYVVGYDAKFVYVPLSFLPEWIGDWVIIAYDKYLAKQKGFTFK
uniref:Uncharacterized protein n=1 Tax=Arion vulgaris TaxID=1028688 RepID=A0A0B7BC98_9EUPU